MLPIELFASRQFSAANLMTLLVYAALGATIFFLVLQLQTVVGYGPLQAGIATLPITIVMLLLAARGGALASRIGPRLPMTFGPLVSATGIALLAGLDSHADVLARRLPGSHDLRARPRPDGRPDHRDGAGGGPGPLRRDRQRGQQRRGPGRVAPGGSRASVRGRAERRRLRRARCVHRSGTSAPCGSAS